MNIDKLYELAEALQKINNDEDLGEQLNAEVKGSTIEVTYDKRIVKKYTYTEKQYNDYLI